MNERIRKMIIIHWTLICISKQYETIYKSKVMSLAYLGRNNNQTPGPAELNWMGGGGRHVPLAQSLPIQVTKFKKHKSFQSPFLYNNVFELLKKRGGLREPIICTPYTFLPVHKKEEKQEYIFLSCAPSILFDLPPSLEPVCSSCYS